MTNLAPDIIAVYLQSATKIFGTWAADLAERWSDDDMPEVKRMVETIIAGVTQFTSSSDIEVQERVSGLLCVHLLRTTSEMRHILL